MSKISHFKDTLNGVLLHNLGVLIITGTEDLLLYPERKDIYENDWAEHNGSEYDLDAPRFKDKNVSLKMGIIADSDADFWEKYNLFFELLKTNKFSKLYIDDHSQWYSVFYEKSSNFKKTTKRLRNVQKILVKFDIDLKVAFDNSAFSADYTRNRRLAVHRSAINDTTILEVAKLLSKDNYVTLEDSHAPEIKKGRTQLQHNAYINGRRAHFTVCNSNSYAIRNALQRIRHKKAVMAVIVCNGEPISGLRKKVIEGAQYQERISGQKFEKIIISNGKEISFI